MSRAKTVFVVGAGASNEVEIPVGLDLRNTIVKMLGLQFDFGNITAGDRPIGFALQHLFKTNRMQDNEAVSYLDAAWRIRDALPLARSIDEFLHTQQDEKITLCGKLAIVRAILAAEKASYLYHEPTHEQPHLPFQELDKTWYNRFMRLLCGEFTKAEIPARLDEISFIVFNYDRCIEHFLFSALKTYYGIDDAETASMLRNLRIYHPYGVVGRLEWQGSTGRMAFGGTPSPEKLLELAAQIKTYKERLGDDAAIYEMRNEIMGAEVIVFLGFAFHRQNMELIQSPEPSNVRKIFATAHGISKIDCEAIDEEISGLVRVLNNSGQYSAYIRDDLRCCGLFDEYSRSLGLA